MLYGYNGKILRVNLTTGTTKIEEMDELFYRTYMGGRSMIAYFLHKELEPDTDPLGSENKLIFASSVITGVAYPGLGRNSVGAKSPLTGLFGESEAGGFWGVELKFAGYDAVIVEGKSDRPVYLLIQDGVAEIKEASYLWGKDTKDAVEAIKAEIGDPKLKFEVIGKAGENLVRYAGIANDLNHYHGRTGLGAVMGSKMLKAIAVRGTKKPPMYDAQKIQELAKWFSLNFKKNVDNNTQNKYGTNQYYFNANIAGSLPTRNFTTGQFPELDYTVDDMHEALKIGSEGCYACPIRCKQVMKSTSPYEIDEAYGGPEYESLSGFGSLCGVKDFNVVCKANELCNRYGMDSVSASVTIAFAMECRERGILTKEQMDGIDLKYGNGEFMLQMLEKIAARDGFGDFLAEGSKRCAEKLGGDAINYAMQVKGQEFALAEPRSKYGMGLAYAVSPTGADHLQHEHDGAFDPKLTGYSHDADEPSVFVKACNPMGILGPVESLSLSADKVRLFTYLQHLFSLFNSLGLCIFAFEPVRTGKINHIPEILKAATGWETSLWEIMKLGERGTTMARCFNLKHGMTKEDDNLPDRMFTELESGPLKGSKLDKAEFEKAISLYYQMMGWDSEGIPTEGKLYELAIGWMYE
ncbi:aldehyde ferredoxin oxidoreductase family protein [Desulfosporosinus sp. BICA1-9]|uniref:aldehyde ferredoxin oxidoreductase family protein n=1 Tax=Desulfosporosinus sp. BICA1-9 TaxID=1531958 RepID=UPI00054B2484|nr:aldehyde ferredoxin oxidoreductase family protein [Desulfosporosinus sp. BICA1-9]KJS50564.1 MAG: hypothetical protein VR66_02070 [Peptococcaceae bacterium BRH_c23]KJS82830.1 MAG: hypothetical protein JL57_23715 [Desulfosporosinus sp. BICA1-9]